MIGDSMGHVAWKMRECGECGGRGGKDFFTILPHFPHLPHLPHLLLAPFPIPYYQ